MGVRFTAKLNNDTKQFEVLKVTDDEPGTDTEVVGSFATSEEANAHVRQLHSEEVTDARTPADGDQPAKKGTAKAAPKAAKK